MKNLRIMISGYGGEYTVGSLTSEQGNFWKKQDEDTLYQNITSPDPGVIQSVYYLGYWHDNDNVIHSYGASENNLKITIYIDNEIVGEYEKLEDFYTFELNEIYFENLEDGPYLVCHAGEKGCFWDGQIEIEDEEVFDIGKVTILTNDIFGENFIVGAQYKDEDMSDNGAGTTGKSFDYRVTYRIDEI